MSSMADAFLKAGIVSETRHKIVCFEEGERINNEIGKNKGKLKTRSQRPASWGVLENARSPREFKKVVRKILEQDSILELVNDILKLFHDLGLREKDGGARLAHILFFVRDELKKDGCDKSTVIKKAFLNAGGKGSRKDAKKKR